MVFPIPISVVGIQFDQKSSFLRGSSLAPPLIREALFSESTNAFSELGIDVLGSKLIKYELDISPRNVEDIKTGSEKIIKNGRRMVSIGGDHSITYPIVAAHYDKYGPMNILHIDAHSDLYHDFEGDPHSHACPFARIMEKKMASRLVQVGIRCLTPHLREQSKKYGVEVIEMKDYGLKAIPQIDGPLYISLDMDALDPAFAPGVSHHEPGGFTSRQVLDIIQNIDAPILGADIVEYNPTRDIHNITAALAGKLVKEILAKMIS